MQNVNLASALDRFGDARILATAVTRDGHCWEGAVNTKVADSFRVASVTKTFTAAAVLRLLAAGQVRLHSAIADHIDPALVGQLDDAGYDTDNITVGRLLSHTSGLPDYASDPAYLTEIFAHPQRHWSRHDQLDWAVTKLQPIGKPGALFHYSDAGYILLGALLERFREPDLNAAYQDLLNLNDLGLHDTYLEGHETAPVRPRAVQRYDGIDISTLHPSTDLHGGGGLISTTTDLALFFRALLTGDVVNPPSLDVMLSPVDAPGNDRGMGLGIFPMPLTDEGWWGHTGYWNICAAAHRHTGAAVAVAVLDRSCDSPLAPDVAAALASQL